MFGVSGVLCVLAMSGANVDLSSLPVWDGKAAQTDWLVNPPAQKAGVFRSRDKSEIVLANGLIARRFRVSPNLATVALDNLVTGERIVRAVKPEAIVDLDGKRYEVGGLHGQKDLAYLDPRWLADMTPGVDDFKFVGFEVGKTKERMPWKRVRHAGNSVWPAPGAALTLWFNAPERLGGTVRVGVHYEIYDGTPAVSKWLTIENCGTDALRVNSFVVDMLGVVEAESIVDTPKEWLKPNLYVTTDYRFGGVADTINNQTVYWSTDPEYTTQVSYELVTPCLLEVKPPHGPDVDVAPGKTFTSFRAYELVQDNWERERSTLATRRLLRTMAPWATENPLMLHLTSTNLETAHKAIDQAAECGFEMIILSFGSGVNMEDASADNIARFKELRDYAKRKGLELGGYSLLASRRIDDESDVINPKTGKTGGTIFGNSPCLGSKWGIDYFKNIRKFIDETGFSLLEHDGSYPGDVCASTTHPGHRGKEDSQWMQFQQITEFYRWCLANGVYLNVPDFYLLSGSNKFFMGYRESNWSLPREQQHIHCRQNLYDGTWQKSPSMGWTFVPLVQYQGGGDAATIEPLKDHLADYEQHLANNLGWGAQACYRGPRLYDSPETKAVVIKWVNWYKKYRDILESDVIHVRRADGNNLDVALHVNPQLATKAMAVVYNPLHTELVQEITLPLYYSGLDKTCKVSQEGGKATTMTLDREYKIRLKVKVAPYSRTWFVIR